MAAEEISAALRKASDTLEQLHKEAVPKAPGYSDKDRDSLLLSIIEATEPPDDWKEQWQRCGLEALYGEGYRLAILRMADNDMAEPQAALARFMSFRYFLEEYTSREWGGILLSRENKELVWLLPQKESGDEAGAMQTYLEQLEQGLFKMLGIRMAYMYTGIYLNAAELPEAYRSAAASEPVSGGRLSGIIRHATAYIEEHLLEDVTLARTAEAIHVSVSHLSRQFLKETGQHFNEYITAKKMLLARKLLRESNRKVYEVAEELGYANPHYFSKLFKDDTGLTPLEFRNQ
jgi:two-component system response regulator YesN